MSNGSNQLIILGNGFDLACGLASSYKNYFIYLSDNNKWGEDFWHSIFKEQYDLELWSDVEKQIMIELRNVSILELFEKEGKVRNSEILSQIFEGIYRLRPVDDLLIKNNYSSIYGSFKEYLQSLKSTKDTLTIFFNRLPIDSKKIRGRLLKDLSSFENSFKSYLEETIATHDEKLVRYLNNEDEKIPYAIQTFFILNYLYIVTKNVNATSGKLFADTIKEKPKNDNLQSGFKDKAVTLFKEKYVTYEETDFEPTILTFNYTNFSDFMNTEARHIHGKLRNFNQPTSIIFGIDYDNLEKNLDIKDEKGKKLDIDLPIEFTKTYRILESSEKTTSTINSDLKFIKFYGHGLGEADYSYFQSIFDTVDLYHGKTTLIFFWSIPKEKDKKEDKKEKKEEKRKEEQIKQFNKVTKLLSEYGKTFSNKDHGKNLLTKLQLEGRLKLAEIPVQEIFDNIKWK